MQGAQSPSSKNRGIGRYTISLAQAMVHTCDRNDQIILALNAAFPESAQSIRDIFKEVLPRDQIRTWTPLVPSEYLTTDNIWRRKTNELMREAFLSSLSPDFVLVSSLFEGLGDNTITSVHRLTGKPLTAVILYDLIPFIHQKSYLSDPAVERWYLEKIEHLKAADLCLAISESSAKEGVMHLGLHHDFCQSISTDADPKFKRVELSVDKEQEFKEKYSLIRPFVMYTGGIDTRKNIDGLIRGYALLPRELRAKHQLAIVCSVPEESQNELYSLAAHAGLGDDELVFTGYVSDNDLITLYSLCSLFIFPSWHEGFGLPALEAMRCGAPVIASNSSSLPEVVGLEEALFDPYCEKSIASVIERGLTDPSFRKKLVENGRHQERRFSWNKSAKATYEAMEKAIRHANQNGSTRKPVHKLPRLAYISPLPPNRSGIAEYSILLLKHLAKRFDIEVIVDQDIITDAWVKLHCPIRTVNWFKENHSSFDRILYNFGNSPFHMHMFGMLKEIPGVVLLHDFYLSGVLHYMQAIGYEKNAFVHELYCSHGYEGLQAHYHSKDKSESIWKYPCSRSVILSSIGTILHSQHTRSLATQWFGDLGKDCAVVPLIRESSAETDRAHARKILSLPENVFVVCSFGGIGPTKLNHRLLRAWLSSELCSSGQCILIYVGENHPGKYGKELSMELKSHPNGASVQITGWVDAQLYNHYLEAADMAVQLRTLSRGETSAAVLDSMNYGLATIINAHGSMAELDDDSVLKISEDFRDQELVAALNTLWNDKKRRLRIGSSAKNTVSSSHNAPLCAEAVADAIEAFYEQNKPVLSELIKRVSGGAGCHLNKSDLLSLSQAIATSFPQPKVVKTLFVDISGLATGAALTDSQHFSRSILGAWLSDPPKGWRVEPVFSQENNKYRYARSYTTSLLKFQSPSMVDNVIDFCNGDIFFVLDCKPGLQKHDAAYFKFLRQNGVIVSFMIHDLLFITQPERFTPEASDLFFKWLRIVCESDGAVCTSKLEMDELSKWRSKTLGIPPSRFQLDWLNPRSWQSWQESASNLFSMISESTQEHFRNP
jgi:glycosyltransferase involved in cell wall biosynthesis